MDRQVESFIQGDLKDYNEVEAEYPFIEFDLPSGLLGSSSLLNMISNKKKEGLLLTLRLSKGLVPIGRISMQEVIKYDFFDVYLHVDKDTVHKLDAEYYSKVIL